MLRSTGSRPTPSGASEATCPGTGVRYRPGHPGLLAAFVLRATIQPVFIWLRLHTFDIFLLLAFLVATKALSRRLTEQGKRLKRTTKLVMFVLVIVAMRVEVYQYVASYFKYCRFHEVDLAELPTTDFERVQPVESLRTLADGVMDQNRHPSDPDFVRIGDKYRFTMAIQPDTTLSRLTGTIDEVFDIPGSAAAPDFSRESRHQVGFAVGEHMLWGKNSRTCAIKSLPPWRFLSYSPEDVKYVLDDKEEMVEVISLSRLGGSWWSRWVFPSPEFGGVLVIRQAKAASDTHCGGCSSEKENGSRRRRSPTMASCEARTWFPTKCRAMRPRVSASSVGFWPLSLGEAITATPSFRK